MNLYSQDAYYFGADEIYSFHMGIMARMQTEKLEYSPEDYVEAASGNAEITPILLRKLNSVADLIDDAVEIEDFQAIGVQCREILIELANEIYEPFMANNEEQPKGADYKKKAELFIRYFLSGADNSDYRSIYKKMTEAAWDFVNKITHSKNATFYEVSSCVAMCISVVSVYENINQKSRDPIAKYLCTNCKSKKLKIINDRRNKDGTVEKFILKCEECGDIMEIELE